MTGRNRERQGGREKESENEREKERRRDRWADDGRDGYGERVGKPAGATDGRIRERERKDAIARRAVSAFFVKAPTAGRTARGSSPLTVGKHMTAPSNLFAKFAEPPLSATGRERISPFVRRRHLRAVARHPPHAIRKYYYSIKSRDL